VPVLTLFGGLGIHAAVAASIVSVIACSGGSAAPFLRSGLTNIRIAIVLEVATTLGALTGVVLAGILSVSFLYFLFAAVLLVSAELDEVLSLSDRVIVLYEGRIVGEVDPKSVSEEEIGLMMTGGRPKAGA